MKHRSREQLFREAVIQFLGAGEKATPEDEYCKACKQLPDYQPGDCEECDRNLIEVIDE